MKTIAIPYYSGSRHTETLAKFVAEGINAEAGLKAILLDVSDLTNLNWNILHNASAIVFGSPTYMGGVAGAFKQFMDETSNVWGEQKWADKIGAAFTVGTSPSGDKLNTLLQLSVFGMQHGMVWVGLNHIGSKHTGDGLFINEPGSWTGLMALSSRDKEELITPEDARTAKLFGARIAKAVLQWEKGKEI